MAKATDKTPLVVDTREPLDTAYRFDPERATVARAKLDYGDYSVAGFTDRWACERKTLDDAVRSITWERDRFFRELQQLATFDFARVVIEATPEDVSYHRYNAIGVHPNSVFGTLAAIECDIGVPVVWAYDREHAEEYVLRVLTRLWRAAVRDARQAEMDFPGATGE